LIQAERPGLYAGFQYAYTTLWFSTPFFALSMGFSLLYIFASRWDRGAPCQPLPSYRTPERREDLYLVLGEQHHRTSPTRATMPRWLVVPERGLYTGIAIIARSARARRHPSLSSIEQLFARRIPPGRSVAGPRRKATSPARPSPPGHGRGDDYTEVSLDPATATTR
jgi:hypothetical protein